MKKRFLLLIPILGALIIPVPAPAQEPFGEIAAEPNPCRIRPGEDMCEVHLIWHTRNVARAKVFVRSEGRHAAEEKEFGNAVACESNRCRAPWIHGETRYTFKLFDFTRGDRGRELASVTVTAERVP